MCSYCNIEKLSWCHRKTQHSFRKMEMLYKSAYQHLHISTLQYLQHHYMVQDLSVSVSPCKPSSTIVNHESLSTILPRPIAMHCSYYLTLVCPLLRSGWKQFLHQRDAVGGTFSFSHQSLCHSMNYFVKVVELNI